MCRIIGNKFGIKAFYTAVVGAVLSAWIIISVDLFQLNSSFRELRKTGVKKLMPLDPCLEKTKMVTPTGIPIKTVFANHKTGCIALKTDELEFYSSNTWFPAINSKEGRSIHCATPSIAEDPYVNISYSIGLAGIIIASSTLLISLSLIWWLCTGWCKCGYASQEKIVAPVSYV